MSTRSVRSSRKEIKRTRPPSVFDRNRSELRKINELKENQKRELENARSKSEKTKARIRANSALMHQAIVDGTVNDIIKHRRCVSNLAFIEHYSNLNQQSSKELDEEINANFADRNDENSFSFSPTAEGPVQPETPSFVPDREKLFRPKREQPKVDLREAAKKPKWALTEAEHRQLSQKNGEENIVEFMENLNFDDFSKRFDKFDFSPEKPERLSGKQPQIDFFTPSVNFKKQPRTNPSSYPSGSSKKESSNGVEDSFSMNQVLPSTSSRIHRPLTAKNKRNISPAYNLEQRRTSTAREEWNSNFDHSERKLNVESKQMADIVLRHFKSLAGVHSNKSIRRLLSRNTSLEKSRVEKICLPCSP